MSPVLVTGGSGYVGRQLIAALLRDGTGVRTTVRSLDREAGLRKAVRRGGADDAGLEVVVADLMADGGWPSAVAGCADIYHVASPMIQPKDPDEVIAPAREGTLRVLRAARDAGARRAVLTSSFAAVGYTPKPGADYTEADWTDPDTPGLPPYPRSKAIAERAAWDFIAREGGGTELVSGQPDGHLRANPGRGGAFHAAADQGDAGRGDDRRAAPAVRRGRRARRGGRAHPGDDHARGGR